MASMTAMAIARTPTLVIDCPDAGELAAFYADLLGWEVSAEEDWVEIRPSEGGSTICFQSVVGYRPPQWPWQQHPQQMHLDVVVDDLDEAEQAVVALGASRHTHQPGTTFRVFVDPAGHPFCLCLS